MSAESCAVSACGWRFGRVLRGATAPPASSRAMPLPFEGLALAVAVQWRGQLAGGDALALRETHLKRALGTPVGRDGLSRPTATTRRPGCA